MKKSEPKLILNIGLENAELEEKVKIAMDEYTDKVIAKNLDDTIAKIVEKRIDKLVNGSNWDSLHKINGKSLDLFVREKTEAVIADVIEANAKRILAEKLAKLI